MKLRISSCKAVAARKDMTRFAPVWGGYLVMLGMILLLLTESRLDYWFASNLADLTQIMAAINCGYALLVAQVLFGDLYNSRMCNALHALPLKREHWFSVHVASGIWFSLIPTAVLAAVCVPMIHLYSNVVNGWQIPLYWWAATNLQYLFFFGLAVFSAFCVGNRFAMAVVYGILNFASVLMMILVNSLYIPLLHGVILPQDPFILLCPVAHCISREGYLDMKQQETGRTYIDAYGMETRERIGVFRVYDEAWQYVLVIALVGIVLLLLARAMYRRRKLECAGDFAAVRALEPVFQILIPLMAAAGFVLFKSMFFGSSDTMFVYMALGLVAGWFAAKMFLKRTSRVFGWRNWPGLAVMVLLLAGSLYVTRLDPLGITTWIPEIPQLQSAQMQLSYFGGRHTTEDPEEIADFLQVHALALDRRLTEEDLRTDTSNSIAYITLTYTQDNGWTSKRCYYIKTDTPEGEIINRYFSTVSKVLENNTNMKNLTDGADLLRRVAKPAYINIQGETVAAEYLTEEFATELMEAIIADCEAGTMTQNQAFHKERVIDVEGGFLDSYYLDVRMENNNHFYLDVYADCEHTLAVLEKTGIPDVLRENAAQGRFG